MKKFETNFVIILIECIKENEKCTINILINIEIGKVI